jgi:hypothetical protein
VTSVTKPGLLAAALVLVAGAVVACGDDGDGGGSDNPPSTREFCGALKEFKDTVAGVTPTDEKEVEAYVKALKEGADRLAEVGTPAEMPDDARDGFAITVDRIRALPDDATQDDLGQLGDVSDAEQKKLDALADYIEDACPELGDQTESESESP